MSNLRSLLPPGWPRPKGYSNGILAEGKMVFVAGMIGWNEKEEFESLEFSGQFEQTIKNTLAVLAEAGARPEHIARMTWYITDRKKYLNSLKEIGQIYREHIGSHFPAMAVIEVKSLMESKALIEIESTAVIPQNS